MDVIELVQKQNPDFGREALLEAFVNACFSETTGELLGDVHEFNRVLNLLGRKDLNLGDIPNRIGAISFEEKQAIHIRFRELTRSAPKSERAKKDRSRSCPYLQNLTQTELMALEAFDSSGQVVTNPAVATTLVQAHLEGWLPVVALPIDAKEILVQCMNQGDMQAAYLLGVKHLSSIKKNGDFKESMNSDEKRRYLIESDEERLSYLKAAKAHGNPAAIGWFEQKEMEEEMYESLSGEDELYENWRALDIERALRLGPGSTGQKKYYWGVMLAEANSGQFLSLKKSKPDLAEYRSRHELAYQWINEAAKSNAEARYYLAKEYERFNFFSPEGRSKNLQKRLRGIRDVAEIEKELDLVRSAAFPEDGVEPYYPAFIDLAEKALFRIARSQSQETDSITKFYEVRRYLIDGVGRIEKPDCKQALRIALLWESIAIEGYIEKAIHYYSLAAKDSAFAAYKCAIYSLRAMRPGADTSSIRIKFSLALNAPLRHGESLDEKAREYSDIALKIGWVPDSEPASWEEASMLLMKQIDGTGYKPQMRDTWILPSDVDLLLQHSLSYERYRHWISQWREVLTKSVERHETTSLEVWVQATLDKKLKQMYLLYGASEPSSILRLLSAMANDPDYLNSALVMKGIDASSLLVKYLFAHLTLLQVNGQGKALGEFREVLGMADAMQNGPGGRGVSFHATSLKWLQSKSQDGINAAQPNCRRVSISEEMNGETTEFGGLFLNLILQNLENEAIPGGSIATEVIYTDRYINTPFKVVLLANAIKAVVTHLRVQERWRDGMVNIYAGEKLIEVSGYGSMNRSDSFYDAMDRNAILRAILTQSNIEASLLWSKAPHGRAFIVRFSDKSELRIDIDKGISFWKASRRNGFFNDGYDSSWTLDEKVEFLASNAFLVDTTEAGCELFVEWHDGKV